MFTKNAPQSRPLGRAGPPFGGPPSAGVPGAAAAAVNEVNGAAGHSAQAAGYNYKQ